MRAMSRGAVKRVMGMALAVPQLACRMAVVLKTSASLASNCAVRPMSRCVLFITIVDHGFGSWLGHHHQYDYECNSTGTNIALFYFEMAVFSPPGHEIRDGSHQ